MMLDTTRPVETPEGIELALRVAGPVVRALAWAMDFCIRAFIYTILFYLLFLFGKLGIGLWLVYIFIIEWFYPVLFEVYKQGATPGKRAMKIKVLHELGTPVDWSTSMIRNLLLTVDFLPFLYGFGLLSMAGTVVVYEEEMLIKKKISLPDEAPQAMPVTLPLEEQEAIIKFAERGQTLNRENGRGGD